MTNEQHPAERHERPAQPHGAYGPLRPDDEISLADLFDALRRRWLIWVVTTVLAAAVAAVYVAMRTPQFSYSATVRIGSLPLLGERVERPSMPIDTPDNVVVELERRYLAGAERASDELPEVSASRVGGSDMVELTATAPGAAQDAVTRVMERALARLVRDHRQALAGRLSELRGGVASMLNIPGRGNRESKIEALEQALELLDAPLDDEVVETQARAESLLQSVDPLLRPTRILALPARSEEPTGVSPAVIVVLALILGLGAGVVLALLVDAISRERHRTPPAAS